jgi:hypothetical protein
MGWLETDHFSFLAEAIDSQFQIEVNISYRVVHQNNNTRGYEALGKSSRS